ncbi:MAG: helix-turn-helix domain-containing protein [Ruminococcus sp.]|nr:helix-turn-helix domain-containing protein [Ruminococcus sp.]
MSIELLNATSASSSAFRVVCGEMIFTEKSISHHEALFGCLKSGSVTLETAESELKLREGDIYFVSPNTRYKLTNKQNAAIDVITVNFTNPAAVTQDYLPQSIIRAMVNGNCTNVARIKSGDAAHDRLLDCINIATRAESEKPEFFQLLVYGKMYEAFYELFANKYVRVIDVESKSKKYRALQRVTNYIDEHYIDGLSLDDVASSTGISRYYVSHLFKELMDTTFVGYVNELRLNRAAMLLMTSDSPIIEIAAMSGFNNLSNFNRAFKLYFGKTPSAYRKA